MAENLIEKITSEVTAYYAKVNQYRPDNSIELRSKLRKTIQAKLQSYADGKLIHSFTVICDESNNNTRDVKQPVKLEVIVQISKSSPKHIISLPAQKSNPRAPKSGNSGNSLWNKSKISADLLWDKLFGK